MSGLETLEELQRINPEIQVVMMTAYGELDILVETRSRVSNIILTSPLIWMKSVIWSGLADGGKGQAEARERPVNCLTLRFHSSMSAVKRGFQYQAAKYYNSRLGQHILKW